jgi:hypothetical protein
VSTPVLPSRSSDGLGIHCKWAKPLDFQVQAEREPALRAIGNLGRIASPVNQNAFTAALGVVFSYWLVWRNCPIMHRRRVRIIGKSQERVTSRRKSPMRQLPLFLLVTFSLTVSLATRTFHFKVRHGTSVQSVSSTATRQHLDKDAARWPAPVQTFAMLDSPTFYPRVAPAGPPLPGLLFDESFYNRPPPCC